MPSLPPGITRAGPQAEAAACALEDVARGCAHQLVAVFGPGLQGAVRDARLKPCHGSPADLSTLLTGMLASRE